MPASYQPVLTMVTWRPLVRSTDGPQPASTTAAARGSVRTSARMRAILVQPSEDPHLDPLERFLARDPASEELGEVRSLDAEDARSRVGVCRREPLTVVVALRGNRQPLARSDAERAAVREHGV